MRYLSSGTSCPVRYLLEAMCGAGEGKPYMDAAGAVHWPMAFLYPETMQMDAGQPPRKPV